MRLSILLAALLLTVTQGPAVAGSGNVNPHVVQFPLPSATSPGRPVVVARLRQLDKGQLEYARGFEDEGCNDYNFDAKVLLDTPVFFSIEMSTYWTCDGRAAQGGMAPLLFEMTSGLEYDFSRLYHVRDANGALVAALRKVVARRVNVAPLGMSRQEVVEAVEKDLSHGSPYLFVTKRGVRAWPEATIVWLDDVVLTWADLRPYLDAPEAKRIGWQIP